jgi:hypothetical protein
MYPARGLSEQAPAPSSSSSVHFLPDSVSQVPGAERSLLLFRDVLCICASGEPLLPLPGMKDHQLHHPEIARKHT